jgi:integrase
MADKEKHYASTGAVSTLKRWQKVCRSRPFALLHVLPLVETEGHHFMAVLRHADSGTSTNVWLRILHNHAVDMGWLLAPVLPKKVWPKIHYNERQGITEAEHRRILALAGEGTEEADYYEVLWETGGSQSDIATLDADRIDWDQRSILYRRMKTQNRGYEFAKVRLGARLVAVLERLPKQGPLFPQLAAMSLENRARLFRRRVHALGLKNISLHCYRYAWAERARKAQVPLRVAMETLGHQSRAVHQAYAKKVEVDLMPLEYYEQKAKETIVAFKDYIEPKPDRQSTATTGTG